MENFEIIVQSVYDGVLDCLKDNDYIVVDFQTQPDSIPFITIQVDLSGEKYEIPLGIGIYAALLDDRDRLGNKKLSQYLNSLEKTHKYEQINELYNYYCDLRNSSINHLDKLENRDAEIEKFRGVVLKQTVSDIVKKDLELRQQYEQMILDDPNQIFDNDDMQIEGNQADSQSYIDVQLKPGQMLFSDNGHGLRVDGNYITFEYTCLEDLTDVKDIDDLIQEKKSLPYYFTHCFQRCELIDQSHYTFKTESAIVKSFERLEHSIARPGVIIKNGKEALVIDFNRSCKVTNSFNHSQFEDQMNIHLWNLMIATNLVQGAVIYNSFELFATTLAFVKGCNFTNLKSSHQGGIDNITHIPIHDNSYNFFKFNLIKQYQDTKSHNERIKNLGEVIYESQQRNKDGSLLPTVFALVLKQANQNFLHCPQKIFIIKANNKGDFTIAEASNRQEPLYKAIRGNQKVESKKTTIFKAYLEKLLGKDFPQRKDYDGYSLYKLVFESGSGSIKYKHIEMLHQLFFNVPKFQVATEYEKLRQVVYEQSRKYHDLFKINPYEKYDDQLNQVRQKIAFIDATLMDFDANCAKFAGFYNTADKRKRVINSQYSELQRDITRWLVQLRSIFMSVIQMDSTNGDIKGLNQVFVKALTKLINGYSYNHTQTKPYLIKVVRVIIRYTKNQIQPREVTDQAIMDLNECLKGIIQRTGVSKDLFGKVDNDNFFKLQVSSRSQGQNPQMLYHSDLLDSNDNQRGHHRSVSKNPRVDIKQQRNSSAQQEVASSVKFGSDFLFDDDNENLFQ